MAGGIERDVYLMTDRQIKMLKMTESGVDFDKDIAPSERGLLMYLEKNGYCYVKHLSTVYHISEKGRAYLHSLEQKDKEHAEKEAEKKSDRRFQLFNTLFGAVIGSLITLLIEHHSCLIDFFLNLFSQVRLK